MSSEIKCARDRVLCALSVARERLSIQELASEAHLDPSAVRKALRCLESEGLAERVREGRTDLWAGGYEHETRPWEGEAVAPWPMDDED